MDDVKDLMVCSACATCVKYIGKYSALGIKQRLLESNRLTDIWAIVEGYSPVCEVDCDDLYLVEKYVTDPLNCKLSSGERVRVGNLLKQLSDIAQSLQHENNT